MSIEQFLEDTIWSAIRGSEELAALLQDLIAYRARLPELEPATAWESAADQRRRHAAGQAAALRTLVERDEPITFEAAAGEEASPGEPP